MKSTNELIQLKIKQKTKENSFTVHKNKTRKQALQAKEWTFIICVMR